MLLEELFHSLIARSNATQSERSKEGEIILKRLRDLGDPAHSENDTAASSREDDIQNTAPSGSN